MAGLGVLPGLLRSARRPDVVTMRQPRLEIEYCTQCRWLLRAAWMAQELLATFETELGEAALIPGADGVFEVRLDDETIWSRKARGAFPDLAALKRLMRDRIAPDRHLGHSERRSQGEPRSRTRND
ncbi:MAG TPA: SelT/SelW/SelH family protein [Pseudonocardiaceae bacterium]|jgi:selenoprotein W-related protein|nr:SelT/SelW/SelH family protein [Pseudonocardiaceae bacterium]